MRTESGALVEWNRCYSDVRFSGHWMPDGWNGDGATTTMGAFALGAAD